MRDYTSHAEEKDEFTWKVTLSDKETGRTIALVYLDKTSFPTKNDAIGYLEEGYKRDHKDRKKKSSKAKPKRKICKCKK